MSFEDFVRSFYNDLSSNPVAVLPGLDTLASPTSDKGKTLNSIIQAIGASQGKSCSAGTFRGNDTVICTNQLPNVNKGQALYYVPNTKEWFVRDYTKSNKNKTDLGLQPNNELLGNNAFGSISGKTFPADGSIGAGPVVPNSDWLTPDSIDPFLYGGLKADQNQSAFELLSWSRSETYDSKSVSNSGNPVPAFFDDSAQSGDKALFAALGANIGGGSPLLPTSGGSISSKFATLWSGFPGAQKVSSDVTIISGVNLEDSLKAIDSDSQLPSSNGKTYATMVMNPNEAIRDTADKVVGYLKAAGPQGYLTPTAARSLIMQAISVRDGGFADAPQNNRITYAGQNTLQIPERDGVAFEIVDRIYKDPALKNMLFGANAPKSAVIKTLLAGANRIDPATRLYNFDNGNGEKVLIADASMNKDEAKSRGLKTGYNPEGWRRDARPRVFANTAGGGKTALVVFMPDVDEVKEQAARYGLPEGSWMQTYQVAATAEAISSIAYYSGRPDYSALFALALMDDKRTGDFFGITADTRYLRGAMAMGAVQQYKSVSNGESIANRFAGHPKNITDAFLTDVFYTSSAANNNRAASNNGLITAVGDDTVKDNREGGNPVLYARDVVLTMPYVTGERSYTDRATGKRVNFDNLLNFRTTLSKKHNIGGAFGSVSAGNYDGSFNSIAADMMRRAQKGDANAVDLAKYFGFDLSKNDAEIADALNARKTSNTPS